MFNTKLEFENYCLAVDDSYLGLVKKVFASDAQQEVMGIPFPEMSHTEENVWRDYCPTQTKLEECRMPIHQTALELVEQYRDKFHVMEVWYESSDQVDPILVGKNYDSDEDREKDYDWNSTRYLLCRWGEALKPFKEIQQLVHDRYIRREKVRLQKDLNNLEFVAMERYGV